MRNGSHADPSHATVVRDGSHADPSRATRGPRATNQPKTPRIRGRAAGVMGQRSHLLDKGLDPSIPLSEGVPWYLVSRLWPVLRACRGTKLALASLSLTVPRGSDVHAHAFALAAGIASDAGGLLLAIDRGPKAGTVHLHGLGLLYNPAALIKRWRDMTGARAAGKQFTDMSGWTEHLCGESIILMGELAKVIRYVFWPWPERYGVRRLRDVVVSGVFVGPWKAAISDAASDMARTCPRCGRPFPEGKRNDARWCSNACKSAGHRARSRVPRPTACTVAPPF